MPVPRDFLRGKSKWDMETDQAAEAALEEEAEAAASGQEK